MPDVFTYPSRIDLVYLSTLFSFCLGDKKSSRKDAPLGVKNVSDFTYFPSITLNSASQIGKQPHPTTLSVGVTEPRNINNSYTNTIPGSMSGLDGHTVNTL